MPGPHPVTNARACSCPDKWPLLFGGNQGGTARDLRLSSLFLGREFLFIYRFLYTDCTDWTDDTEKNMAELLYKELTYQIRSVLYDVYNTLRPGLREETYKIATLAEMRRRQM